MDANPTPREMSLPSDSSSARSRSISVDDVGVRRLLADGSEESITWADLAAVVVRVIPEGPWKEDVFLMLAASDGTGTAVPSGDPAADALIERLQTLPGFDHDMFVEAMTTDADKAYVVWKAS
ncbi:hypothetical protein ACWGRK_18700 [Saccharomonospora azurea]|uniref:Uncharacterized protein n=1 Tax=Saccharomonospora azurea NA-128 TaxID=882081 RepID=H8GAR8_9PSEU|nr:hypothetical protein [Saccharomonospora azurea]EHY88604.1 hypothetical protein SacazDRAFT_01680 [Saccharomonospora azurea NA-128]